jgi:hypothetical protein
MPKMSKVPKVTKIENKPLKQVSGRKQLLLRALRPVVF